MIKNVGAVDRLIRIILSILIFGWGIWDNNYWGLLGFIPLATGFLNWCPFYIPLKISTVKRRRKRKIRE